MSKYTFIVNVNNAIDVPHFRMHFHEYISRQKLNMYSVESLDELPETVEHISRHIDRNVYQADENELIVCVARNCGPNADINWWTLMTKARVYGACERIIQHKISKIRLLIVDQYYGTDEREIDRRKRLDEEFLRNGYVKEQMPDGECVTREWLGRISEAAADETKVEQLADTIDSYFSSCSLFADFVKDALTSYRELPGEKTDFINLYSSKFETDLIHEGVERVDTLIIPVSGIVNAERRNAQLKIVTFLTGRINDRIKEGVKISEEFERYEFDPAYEALRLDSYRKKLAAEKRNLQKRKDRSKPEVEISFPTMSHISPLTDELMIGNSKEVDQILENVDRFRNMSNWEGEFLALIDRISMFEQELKNYGVQVNEEFHRIKTEAIPGEPEVYKNENAALNAANEQLRQANEDSYKERDKGESTYSSIVDITNQFNIVGNCLRKINNARLAGRGANFVKIFLFAVCAIFIPYSVMQTYIYTGLARGNFWPAVCFAYLVIAVLAARPVAQAALDRSFKKESLKLKALVTRYFEGLQQRQILFHDSVNCMVDIWNAERRMEACKKVVDDRIEDHMRMEYHRNALEDYVSSMDYFSTFIDNYPEDPKGRAIEEISSKIDLNKDITDNSIYWIGR